jgi:hypothetical protein
MWSCFHLSKLGILILSHKKTQAKGPGFCAAEGSRTPTPCGTRS